MNVKDPTKRDFLAWENQTFGADEAYVKRSSNEQEQDLDNHLNLQLISIRLPSELLKDLKFIAKAHGIGYQPMVRDLLSRFATNEKLQIMRTSNERMRLEREQAELEQTQLSNAKNVA